MSLLPSNYVNILARLKVKIRNSRFKALLAANSELLAIYWEIGNTILQQQKKEGWGTKIIDRLASDLHLEFPDFKGLSSRNLKYMRAFAEAYPQFKIVQQPVALNKNSKSKKSVIVQQLVAQLPWGHHLAIITKVKSAEERFFYIEKCIENNWSRSVLSAQIDSKLIKRIGAAHTNFSQTLPAPIADLAKDVVKNPYLFDFISMGEKMQERDLENALISHLKEFMLELGKGFAYVGNQKNIVVGGDDFFLDLLFYNYHLHCFVVFELKVGEFKSEYTGKLNFYINTINEQLKGEKDAPTIGVLLCKTPNETVIKYSLQNIKAPIGVSDYILSTALPKNLKTELPSIKELEAEIEREIEEIKKPVEKKYDRLKELIGELKQPKGKEKRSAKTCEKVFQKVLLPLRDELKKNLALISKEFIGMEMMLWTDGHGHNKDIEAFAFLKKHKEFNEYKIDIKLKGFKPAGTKAFDIWKCVSIKLNNYNYTVGIDNHNPQNILTENLYHDSIDKNKLTEIAEGFIEAIIDDITLQLELIKKRKDG